MAADIVELLQRDWEVALAWVPRDYNAVVICMARAVSLLDKTETQLLDLPFFELEHHLLSDSFACA